MTPSMFETVSPWLVDGSVVTIMGDTVPPRDPEDDEDERQDEPAVIREPDE